MKSSFHNRSLVVGVVLLAIGGCAEDAASPCGDGWEPQAYPVRNGDRVSVSQGAWGDVWLWQGNFQPSCGVGSIQGVGRDMRIHELTSFDDVEVVGHSAFYRVITTPLVASVWSDAKGFFQVSLPPARYSLFAVEDTLFYANRFDGSANIFPFEVQQGEVTEIRFDITYEAAY